MRPNGTGSGRRRWPGPTTCAIIVHTALERAEALARHGDVGDRAAAAHHASKARSDAEELGLVYLAARADRVGAVPAQPPEAPVTMHREGETWTITGAGETCRVKDSRGARMLARLVETPGKEVHALDLAGGGPGSGAVDLGDAGELLDGEEKAAYRARLAALRDEIAEAEAWNDAARLARARAEEEALVAELGRAVGLGGRDRQAGAPAERARVSVKRRLDDVIGRVVEVAPRLGEHLETTLRTGMFCCYDPTAPKRSGRA